MTLKENIIKLLRNQPQPISGEEMGRIFNVSRAAVWKAIKSLEKEGYSFSAVTNRGYILSGGDVLTPEEIRQGLKDVPADAEIEVLKEVDSTNNYLKARVACGTKNMCAVFADRQTAGRGRQGKSFFSPDKKGMYFSMLMPGSECDVMFCTVASAVAVCRTIEQISLHSPKIKWINDIFIDGKKTAGILSEAISDLESGEIACVVIGIGINLNNKNFPAELRDIVTSVTTDFSRSQIGAILLNELYCCLTKLKREQLIEEYRSRLFILGKKINFMIGNVKTDGIAKDINDSCNLIVDCDGKEIVLKAGEISIKI